jgi:hypothetical protein
MKNRKLSFGIMLVMTTALLSLAGNLAFAAPLTPEMAAKREMVRKQQEQRVTPEKRQAAAEELKAERLKIYKAKQGALQSNPSSSKIN